MAQWLRALPEPTSSKSKNKQSRLKLGFSTSNHLIEGKFLTGVPPPGFLLISVKVTTKDSHHRCLPQGLVLGRMMP